MIDINVKVLKMRVQSVNNHISEFMPKKYSDEELLQHIRDLADELGHTPTKNEMNEAEGRPSTTPYYNRFDSWTDAVKRAGLTPIGKGKQKMYSREELLNEIQCLANELGHTPTKEEICEHGNIGQDPYYDRFGSWNNALQEAGFEPHNQGSEFSDQELLNEIQCLANELGHTPTKEEMCEHGDIGQDPYYDRFGSWNNALQEVGFEPNQPSKIQRDDLVAELHRLADEYNQTPTRNLLRENGKYHDDAYMTEFEAWNKALQKAGFNPNQEKNVAKRELLQHIRDLADELGHSPSITDLQENGKYSSTPYYNQFGGWTNAVTEAGLEPNESGGSEPTPREELIVQLQGLNETLGREPNKDDLLDCPDTHSPTPFYREFDNLTEAKQMAGVKTQSDTTNIERTLYKILDDIGIKYETEENLVGYFWVDIIIPEQRVVIEADGNYWHGHPQMRPYDERQQKKIESDTRKDTRLSEEGYHVVRFWGDTITNQKEDIKQKIRKIAESVELPDHGKHVFGPEPEPKSAFDFDSQKERVNHSLSEFTT